MLVGADRDHVWLLGGNQQDGVNIARFARSRVAGFYWPSDVALPTKVGNFAYAGQPSTIGTSVV